MDKWQLQQRQVLPLEVKIELSKQKIREWCEADITRKTDNCATARYLHTFENEYPEIAKEYFNLKFENLNQYK